MNYASAKRHEGWNEVRWCYRFSVPREQTHRERVMGNCWTLENGCGAADSSRRRDGDGGSETNANSGHGAVTGGPRTSPNQRAWGEELHSHMWRTSTCPLT